MQAGYTIGRFNGLVDWRWYQHTKISNQRIEGFAGVQGFYEKLAQEELGRVIAVPAVPPPLTDAEKAAARGNPGLKPVKSKNLDLSAEYYFVSQGKISVGVFRKDISDFFGSTFAPGQLVDWPGHSWWPRMFVPFAVMS